MKNFIKLKKLGVFALYFCLILSLCSAKRCVRKVLPLTTVHIVDRNGFAETISSKDRLSQFQNVDFLRSQPYQKVLLIYGRDSKGDVRSVTTTYYPNGNPKQFLEILNGRANGTYTEWHENGTMNITATVIGGVADLTTIAEKSWLFDGTNTVWDDNGNLIAQINYNQGILEGTAIYYHPCGTLWKKIPYAKDQINGTVEIYKSDGQLLTLTNYCDGCKEGKSIRYWECDKVAAEEFYCSGALIEGQYYDQEGLLISEVKQGMGYKVIYSKTGIKEFQEIQEGYVEGEVKIFEEDGALRRTYHLRGGIKHGEEIDYYQTQSSKGIQAKLSFNWYEGKVQGIAKTWYPNGHLESQKEMANNKKNGLSTSWYKDGNLMMIEEYEEGKLIRGEYFKKGDRTPVSLITNGKGIATIFDAEGHFIQKITYQNSKAELK